jgi:hypothetical protein
VPSADSLERIARSRASKRESDFQAALKRQQAEFDDAQKNAKTRAAVKKNVAKKGEALSGFVKNAIFDWTSPEMMALSVLPFGIGRAVGAGAKVAPKVAAISSVKPRGSKPVETLPVEQISNMYSKEFGRAGNVTPNYWVDKGLMSQKKLDELRASIAREGVKTPLQLDKVRGMDVLVDGHHRLAIAKELGIKELPIRR